MTCRRAVRRIVDLDASDAPGASLARHLGDCTRCAALFRRLRALERTTGLSRDETAAARAAPARIEAERAQRGGAPDRRSATQTQTQTALTERIMAAVREESLAAQTSDQRMHLPGWSVGGAVILTGLVLLQFSRVASWLSQSIGSIVDVALGIMFGIALTIYICMLVWSNLEEVRRVLRFLMR